MEEMNAWCYDEIWCKDINFRNEYHTYLDMIEDVKGHPTIWNKWEHMFKKSKRTKKKSYLYLTLSPDKFLRNLDPTPSNIENLNKWCEKWFNCDKRFYHQFAWVIESGSNHDHLHVHAVMEMKQSQHHARDLKKFWAKYFPNNQLLTTLDLNSKSTDRGEYCKLQFDSEEILQDKLEYFINEKKGTHENQVELGLRGARGFLY